MCFFSGRTLIQTALEQTVFAEDNEDTPRTGKLWQTDEELFEAYSELPRQGTHTPDSHPAILFAQRQRQAHASTI